MTTADRLGAAGLCADDFALLCKQIDGLPPIPTVVARLLTVLAGEDASPAKVEAILGMDAALTARALELANSAQFGLRRRVATVAHATALLGLSRVRELVICATMVSRTPPVLAGYRMHASAAWQHNAGTAILADELARRVAPECLPSAFTAGMLHDVGKLAIGSLLERHYPEVAAAVETGGLGLARAEREVLGIGHSEVGELLLERWGLPREYSLAARWHHEPAGAPADVRRLVGLVHVASGLAHVFGFGADAFGLTRETHDSERAELGLTRSVVEAGVADAVPRVQALAELLAA